MQFRNRFLRKQLGEDKKSPPARRAGRRSDGIRVLDGRFDGSGLLRAFQQGDQLQTQVDGEAESAARGDRAVGHDALAGVCRTSELAFPAGIAGGAAPFQQTELAQDAGGGADGGEAFAGGSVGFQQGGQAGMLTEIFLRLLVYPLPPQTVHLLRMILPVPRHSGQACTFCTIPKRDCCE